MGILDEYIDVTAEGKYLKQCPFCGREFISDSPEGEEPCPECKEFGWD